MSELNRCQGLTKAGAPCGLRPLQGQQYCRYHLPAQQRDAQHDETVTPSRLSYSLPLRYWLFVTSPFQLHSYRLVPPILFIATLTLAATFVIETRLTTPLAPDSVISFLSTAAQIVGVILGISFAVIAFFLQVTVNARHDSYANLLDGAEELGAFTIQMPSSFDYLKPSILDLVMYTNDLHLQDISLFTATRDSWIEKVDEVMEVVERQKMGNLEHHLYIGQLLVVLCSMEHALLEMEVEHAAFLGTEILTKTIGRLVWLLGSILLMLVSFRTLERALPDFVPAVVVGLTVWLGLALGQLVRVLYVVCQNAQNPW